MEERRPVQKLPDELLNNLPELVRYELDEFERQIRKFREGQMGDIKMQKIRLQMGTYAQRQPGVQMQRIKIPYGSLTPDKLRRLADVSDTYANAFMHLTTRQDVQLYFIQLEHVPNMMRELADADITTREACGNTIRNVTATPYSGTSPDDVFDVAPYADALVNYMLRNPICQNMGRKVKIAFESNAVKDDAGLRIHDLGFRAHIEKVDGKPRRGFEVYVGGGLGSNPMLGHRWPEIIPEEEFIPFSAAIIRIFDRYGERKSRMKARMKFLVKKLGFEEFRKRVEEERRVLKPEPEWTSWIEAAHRLDTPPEGPLPEVNINAEMETDPEYLAWKRDAVVMQNTGKHALVHLRIHNGDLSSDDARTLADISEKYT
ncbi:nitrite/sulfite reductase, partial [Balneolaceae bacterium ANBcel3]|nr:nitrite/sulfite reductase [Balneolaceae bacterium ANBcel3]